MTIEMDTLREAPPASLPFAILRALPDGMALRSEAGTMPTLIGRFATFGDWYEIDSWMEGHFLESLKRGAFAKTIAESRDQMKVLFDHGMDPQIGNKVLGPIASLSEGREGPDYEVPLLDTSYNRDLVPGLEASVYGASFRFQVIKDQWDMEPKRSDHNPDGVPERVITEARVYEFGPVTFPANPNATAGVRSLTDRFYEHLRSKSPETFADVLRSAQSRRTPAGPTTGAATPSDEPASATRAVYGRPEKDLAAALQRARRAGVQST